MALNEKQRLTLLKGSEREGWFWKEAFLFAPHETMQLNGLKRWQGSPYNNAEVTAAAVLHTGRLVAVLQNLVDLYNMRTFCPNYGIPSSAMIF